MSDDVVPRRPPSPEQRIRELEAELRTVRAEYHQLQELSGGAIFRAHLQRGDQALATAKAHEQGDAARDEALTAATALWIALRVLHWEAGRADRNLGFAMDAGRVAQEFARTLVPFKRLADTLGDASGTLAVRTVMPLLRAAREALDAHPEFVSRPPDESR